ncbi:MAG: HNH endonuclease [Flavobacterium sp.]|nr:MAG: HNH endonuclease [Flavobacterium sp.]
MDRVNWSRDEFILVMNLYTKIRYGQFNARNSEVIKLAKLLNRTPGAVAYKLVHFSGLDPFHKNRGIKGLANPGNNAIKIYEEFRNNWDELLYESEELLAKYQDQKIEDLHIAETELQQIKTSILEGKEGTDILRLIKTRVNQNLFRKVVMSNYSNSCAICSLDLESLLIASHIKKWSSEQTERLNPENGICLCNIHDKAFEIGFIGINSNYKILISKELHKSKNHNTVDALFFRHENATINLPDKFYPNPSFLEQHLNSTFKG